jgi:hypothetical protein
MRDRSADSLSEQQIGRLLRGLAEADSLAGSRPWALRLEPAGTLRGRGLRMVWTTSLATAAALVLALRAPTPGPLSRAQGDPAFHIDYQAAPAAEAAARIATFRPCADRDAYAVVLFRGWSEECACLTWRVHEFADGSPLARLAAGEPVEIAVDVSGDPPVEQFIILALARRRGDLPTDDDDAQRLLACLNDAAPPSLPGEPDEHYATALQSCLPGSARVVRQPFFAN